MSLGILTLAHWERGDAVRLDDNSVASAYNNTKKLGKMAVGIKFATDATGVMQVIDGSGAAVQIEVDTYAKGVWHPIQIAQIKATSTTTVNTKFELGFAGY